MQPLAILVTISIFAGGTLLGGLDPLGGLALAFVIGLLTNDLVGRYAH